MSLTEKETAVTLTYKAQDGQDGVRQRDNVLLATLGYKPEFRREFSVR